MTAKTRALRQRVRLLRQGAGLTQEELAEKASVAVETVQRLERTGHVSPKTIAAIARALNVDVSEINATGRAFVVACMSEKGGVGRTTLTFNLSVLLASLGNSVCAVQVDERGMLVEECHAERRRSLPSFSSCWMPDPQVIDDWLGSCHAYSHIVIDGTRYRPEVNQVLIGKSDLILIPITHRVMDEPALDILMSQIEARRGLHAAPVLLVFNQCWPNDPELEDDLLKIEKRYGRRFPSLQVGRRKTFATSENGTLSGPINSPILTPRAREARKACQELANLWNMAERVVRRGPNPPSGVDSEVHGQAPICSFLPTVRSRRPAPSPLSRFLALLASARGSQPTQ